MMPEHRVAARPAARAIPRRLKPGVEAKTAICVVPGSNGVGLPEQRDSGGRADPVRYRSIPYQPHPAPYGSADQASHAASLPDAVL